MAPLSELFATAAKLHETGQLQAAEQVYRQILAITPNDAGAHNNLGTVLQAQQKLDDAAAAYRRALELQPDLAQALSNLGTVLMEQGELDQAVASYHCALDLRPNDAAALYNLGNVQQAQGKLDDAVASYRLSLSLRPDHAVAHYNLGNVFWLQLKLDEAVASYRRALELNPDYAEAHNNLANTLIEQGKLTEGLESCCRALELNPEYAEAYNNLGNALLAKGKPDEAIAAYRRALALNPQFPLAHINLGSSLQTQGKLDEAIQCFHRALEFNKGHALAYNNLGIVHKDAGNLDEAINCFRRALAFSPNHAVAQSNLLYTLYFSPAHDAAAIYEEHRLWNQQHAQPLAKLVQPHLNDANPDRRLRIGYVSPDFRWHAEAHFLAPLFASHDHQHFEVFCYSGVAVPDQVTEKLQSYSDVWRTTWGLSDEAVAELVRGDHIDILVDLTMHMAHGRPLLFARKPAPVQACWLAYQGTTGLSTMDYRLTDAHLDPPGLFDAYYSEQSLPLRDSFWCYDPLTDEPPINPLPGMQKGHVTFGSLNNFCKVNDHVLRLWAGVLRAVERSKLIMLAAEGSHRRRTLEFLDRQEIAPERIAFAAARPRLDYLKLYHQIDIGLDTFPYNGQTTTLDALWMGVPVVTIIGQTSAARAGASILRTLPAPELVADSPDQFISIAAGLAKDWKRLSELRATLRQRLQKSPLMDAPRFARSMQAAYRTMWQRWCASRDRQPLA